MSSSGKQVKMESITLDETNQTQMKDKCHTVLLLCPWSKGANRSKGGRSYLGSGFQRVTVYHDMAEWISVWRWEQTAVTVHRVAGRQQRASPPYEGLAESAEAQPSVLLPQRGLVSYNFKSPLQNSSTSWETVFQVWAYREHFRFGSQHVFPCV